MHPSDAMKIIIDEKETFYTKEILKVLIESLSIYPVGSLVQLNNKKIAQVVEAVQGSPLRPVIRIVVEETATAAPEIRVDLSTEHNLYITGLVYDQDYQVKENAGKKA
jgi:hypothetical protein